MKRVGWVILALAVALLAALSRRPPSEAVTLSPQTDSPRNRWSWATFWLALAAVAACWAALAATVAGGIYYLQLQQLIDQSEELESSVNSQAYQGIINTEFSGLLTVLEHPELHSFYLAPFLQSADCSPDDLTHEDKTQYIGAIILFEFFNNIQIQNKHGAVSDELWDVWLRDIDLFLGGYPAMPIIWNAGLRDIYNPDFRETIDGRLPPTSANLSPAANGCRLPHLGIESPSSGS